jgi:hypothetical protein
VTPAEWITIAVTVGTVCIGWGLLQGRVAAVDARVRSLERGNIDGKGRVGALERQMAVVEYKVFERRASRAMLREPNEGEDITPPDRGG